MNRWLLLVPIIALVMIVILGGQQLFSPGKPGFERITRAAPERIFRTLEGGDLQFSNIDSKQNIAVNLFASWCAPCEAEHTQLMEIQKARPGQLYGVLYKDSAENGESFVKKLGNPFTLIAHDPTGQGGLDFGLTGVPETFIISPEGVITLHIRGPLTQSSTQEVINALGQK